jgi:predicted enzyme related to lactoylglutathione lyase
MMLRQNPGASTVNTIQVKKLDDVMKTVERKGGKIVVPKRPIPGVGYLAYFHDPEGNMFALMEPDPAAK